ncbi:MAG: penicillin-binding transpeptidase domain-containing protein, partial [Kofleriaceae bacterium]
MRRLVVLLVACGSNAAPPPPPPPIVAQDAAARVDATFDPAPIAKLWPDGCFVMRDAAGMVHENDRDRCALPRRPFSTFKLANALIAVDAGVLAGPDAAMTWDRKRIPDEKYYLESWRKPHTLRSGIAVSAVPYFRTLALQIGEPRMRAGLAKLDYGNREIGGMLDRFWLSGALRVTAHQQLAFVEALARGKLAMSAHAQDTVRQISLLARDGEAALHGKTGSGPVEDGKGKWLVWQVGWIARGTTILPYAGWLEA